MRKFLILAIALVGVTGLLFAGTQTEAATGDYVLNEPAKYPVILSDEPYEFDAFGIYSATESSGKHQDSKLTKYLEELTNVKINWVEVVEADVFPERQNLILASGDLPDVIMSAWGMSAQQAYTYGVNGTLLPLNDLIEEKMPDLKRHLEEWPAYTAQLTSPDGNIYALPDLEAGCFHCFYSAKFFIYKPWVEGLGLKWPPETTDELYDMLVAFRDRDPNGNGQKDEIPLMGSAAGGWNTNPMFFIMNSFIYTDTSNFLQRDKGKISFVADTKEWRDGLKYLSKLVEEGLLSPETYVQHNDNLRALVEHPDAPKVGSVPAGWFGVFSINGGGTGRFADYWPVAPLKGPNGVQWARFQPAAVRFHTKITNVADRPDIIAQWANWFYEDASGPGVGNQFTWNFAEEGVHWRYLTEEEKKLGLVSRDGTPALTLPIKTDTYGLGADKKDDGWTRAAPRWTPFNVGGLPLEWKEDRSKQEYWLMVWTRDLMKPYGPGDEKYIPPNLVFDDAIMDEMTDLNEAISSGTGVVMQWATEFIVGNRDINSDSDWNEYLNELRRAGKDRYIELWQQTITNAGY
jgi:putative aldouronate transport system substrate-binding protein